MSDPVIQPNRKFEEIYDAIAAARLGDFELAVTHLQKAQEDVDTVVSDRRQPIVCIALTSVLQAKLLDCTFIQLCGACLSD